MLARASSQLLPLVFTTAVPPSGANKEATVTLLSSGMEGRTTRYLHNQKYFIHYYQNRVRCIWDPKHGHQPQWLVLAQHLLDQQGHPGHHLVAQPGVHGRVRLYRGDRVEVRQVLMLLRLSSNIIHGFFGNIFFDN